MDVKECVHFCWEKGDPRREGNVQFGLEAKCRTLDDVKSTGSKEFFWPHTRTPEVLD